MRKTVVRLLKRGEKETIPRRRRGRKTGKKESKGSPRSQPKRSFERGTIPAESL